MIEKAEQELGARNRNDSLQVLFEQAKRIEDLENAQNSGPTMEQYESLLNRVEQLEASLQDNSY